MGTLILVGWGILSMLGVGSVVALVATIRALNNNNFTEQTIQEVPQIQVPDIISLDADISVRGSKYQSKSSASGQRNTLAHVFLQNYVKETKWIASEKPNFAIWIKQLDVLLNETLRSSEKRISSDRLDLMMYYMLAAKEVGKISDVDFEKLKQASKLEGQEIPT